MQVSSTHEKTLVDVLRDVWRGRLYVLSFTVLFLVIALLFMALAQPYYRADMIVAPASPMGRGMQPSAQIGEGSMQVQMEDLQSTAAFMKFETIYDGFSVAKVLMRDREVMNALSFDRAFEFSKGREPHTPELLEEYLSRRVTLEPVSGTPLRRLSYLHPNQEFATYMIGRVHRVTDEIIRRRILQETNGRIEYLNAALAKTNNPDHRRNLTALLMEQERLKMLVSLDQPYAATIVEMPHVSSKPRWPDPFLVYGAAFLIGGLLGYLVYGFVGEKRGPDNG